VARILEIVSNLAASINRREVYMELKGWRTGFLESESKTSHAGHSNWYSFVGFIHGFI
jgi:hypothetical protein